MPFETLAEIESKLPGETVIVHKTGTYIAGMSSMWGHTGIPAAGSQGAGLNGALADRTTTGAIILPRLPTTANSSHLARIDHHSNTTSAASYFYLMDRLWSNTLGNATGTQSITQPALTRYTTGEDVQAWVMWSVASSSTTTVLTLNYTNSAGVSGRSATTSLSGIQSAQRTIPLNLQAGDTGVRSIQSVAWSTAYGSGTAHLVLRMPICTIPAAVLGASSQRLDVIRLGLPSIMDNAALEIMGSTVAGTGTWNYMAEFNFLQE